MKNKLLKASDLQKIQVEDNGEKLVSFAGVRVRETVATMLLRVQRRLNAHQLLVVEGYRSPERQERFFLQEFQKRVRPDWNLEETIEQTHKFVALPSVAGHPTGGAVDVTLAINGQGVSMGGTIADFSNPELLPTFSPLVTAEQAKWRFLLHDAMLAEGFAPFYGEWWHFSYGDREWAAFYGKTQSLYAPQEWGQA
jgi:D-alanyl-D-alanine dipeptidase